jgi:hypothetical protein
VLALLVGGLQSGAGLTWVIAALGGLVAWLIVARQWLAPRAARRAHLVQRSTRFEGPSLVLPDGSAVPVAVLQRERVLLVADWLVVHCAIAGASAAFHTAGQRQIRALLPHASGFELGGGGRRWDGVDGTALDGGAALERVGVDVQNGAQSLWLPSQVREILPLRVIQPRVAGARGVDDPMALGVVEGSRWCPLAEAPKQAVDRYLICRWAAKARGLTGAG